MIIIIMIMFIMLIIITIMMMIIIIAIILIITVISRLCGRRESEREMGRIILKQGAATLRGPSCQPVLRERERKREREREDDAIT